MIVSINKPRWKNKEWSLSLFPYLSITKISNLVIAINFGWLFWGITISNDFNMTQEEKAKAYDEALKVIKKCVPDENGFITIYPQEIFPELKEIEDERIRKRIIDILENDKKHYLEEIAWLEKQGKQKPIIEMKSPEESLGIDSDTYNKIVDECIYGEQKPV